MSRVRHTFSGCSCGHTEHVGAPNWKERQGWNVVCPECSAIEEREGVVIATGTIEWAQHHSVADGAIVKLNGKHARIVSIVEIKRLGGIYSTGYVRMKVREAAA